MGLPGKALAVGLMLWFQSGLTRRRTVHFCLAHAATQGVPTSTARRAVRELERAGLVTVQRKPGRGLDVTLLDADEAA
jgi:DNA-binding IscR family transcriptional regulator